MAITLTIDGREVQAEPGMTILEVAQANGIRIPRLCHHPKLQPAGNCRLCVVEIGKGRALQTACTMPVADGQEIVTDSERLRKLRRDALALILAEHPFTCLVCKAGCGDYQMTVRKAMVTTGCQYCPANGQCELQVLVAELKLEDMPCPVRYRGLPVERDDPFFDRDYNLCILCGRCVRVCQDVRHASVLGFVGRGDRMLVGSSFRRSHLEMQCQFCGACVDVCPTGALFDKRAKWEGPPDAVTASVCPYCSVGCVLELETRAQRVIRGVAGDGGANDGQLCVRGRFGVVDIVHHLRRLKAPLVRRDGRLVEVAWPEALAFVARGLAPHRGPAFAALGDVSMTNEDAYSLQRFARLAMASPHLALANAVHLEAAEATALVGSVPGSDRTAIIRELRAADCVLALATDVLESHPMVGLELRHARAAGATLLTVDSRWHLTAHEADVALSVQPGTEHLLLAGLAEVLDPAQALGPAQAVGPAQALGQLLEAAGASESTVRLAAERLAAARAPIVLVGAALFQPPNGTACLAALVNLIARWPQARVLLLPGPGNVVGALDMGMHPGLLPGYLSPADAAHRERLAKKWGSAPPAPAPDHEARSLLAGPAVRALLAVGPLPEAAAWPQLAFAVAVDLVAHPTALERAHAILPLTSFAEVEATVTNLEGRVQRLRPAIPPSGQARPLWRILQDLAHALAAESGTPAGPWSFESADDVLAEIAEVVPAYRSAAAAGGSGSLARRFDLSDLWQVRPVDLQAPRSAAAGHHSIAERTPDAYFGLSLITEVEGMSQLQAAKARHWASTMPSAGVSSPPVVGSTARHDGPATGQSATTIRDGVES